MFFGISANLASTERDWAVDDHGLRVVSSRRRIVVVVSRALERENEAKQGNDRLQ